MFTALAHNLGDAGGWDSDYDQVYRVVDVADRVVTLQALDFGMFAVDGIDLAGESAFADVAQHLCADGTFVIGCADDGDGLGFENLVKVVFLHLYKLLGWW